MCISGEVDTSSQITTVVTGNRSKLAWQTESRPITCAQLGGQDIGKLYLEVLDSMPPVTRKNPADFTLSGEFQVVMTDYLRGDLGELTINEAVDYFCDKMKEMNL